MTKLKKQKPHYIWKDRKRILGLPITFIRYRMSEDRLFFETGLFNLRGEEILLYRIRDTEMMGDIGGPGGGPCIHGGTIDMDGDGMPDMIENL